MSEGLQWSFVKYQDNQSCLNLIEGSPVGVFSLLNEVCSQVSFIFLFNHFNDHLTLKEAEALFCMELKSVSVVIFIFKLMFSTIVLYRKVVLIERLMHRHSGFAYRRSCVITPTSAGTGSARSHTLPSPIMPVKSTTRYRGWWRKTRCVERAFEHVHGVDHTSISSSVIWCYRIQSHQNSSAFFRSLTTSCCTRCSLTITQRTRPPKASVKSLWSPSSR